MPSDDEEGSFVLNIVSKPVPQKGNRPPKAKAQAPKPADGVTEPTKPSINKSDHSGQPSTALVGGTATKQSAPTTGTGTGTPAKPTPSSSSSSSSSSKSAVTSSSTSSTSSSASSAPSSTQSTTPKSSGTIAKPKTPASDSVVSVPQPSTTTGPVQPSVTPKPKPRSDSSTSAGVTNFGSAHKPQSQTLQPSGQSGRDGRDSTNMSHSSTGQALAQPTRTPRTKVSLSRMISDEFGLDSIPTTVKKQKLAAAEALAASSSAEDSADGPSQALLDAISKSKRREEQDLHATDARVVPAGAKTSDSRPSCAETEQRSNVDVTLWSTQSFAECADPVRLNSYLIKSLTDRLHVTNMTRIQWQSLCAFFDPKYRKNDLLIRSETGSGKTLAYLIPIVQSLLQEEETRGSHIDRSAGTVVFVILPTRELCMQTNMVAELLLKPFPQFVVGTLMGGERMKSEKARLRKGVTILLGTPGRILDHLKNTQSFKYDSWRYLVIDEADRILDLGFEKDLCEIVQRLRITARQASANQQFVGERRSLLISATLKQSALEQLHRMALVNPIRVDQIGIQESSEATAAAAAAAASRSTGPNSGKSAGAPNALPIDSSVNFNDSNTPLGAYAEPSTDSGSSAVARSAAALDVVHIPPSVRQYYVLVPSKWRLVALLAFLRSRVGRPTGKKAKILVFCSCCDQVQFFFHLFARLRYTVDPSLGDSDESGGGSRTGSNAGGSFRPWKKPQQQQLHQQKGQQQQQQHQQNEGGKSGGGDAILPPLRFHRDQPIAAPATVMNSSNVSVTLNNVYGAAPPSTAAAGAESSGSGGTNATAGSSSSSKTKQTPSKDAPSNRDEGFDRTLYEWSETNYVRRYCASSTLMGGTKAGGKSAKSEPQPPTPAAVPNPSSADEDYVFPVPIFQLHGSMSQQERSRTYFAFRNISENDGAVLFCTDVAARGLDFPDVRWVVQYDAPQDTREYLHRIGRTARLGAAGDSVLFLRPEEQGYVDYLRKLNLVLKGIASSTLFDTLLLMFGAEAAAKASRLAKSLQAKAKAAKARALESGAAGKTKPTEEEEDEAIVGIGPGRVASALVLRALQQFVYPPASRKSTDGSGSGFDHGDDDEDDDDEEDDDDDSEDDFNSGSKKGGKSGKGGKGSNTPAKKSKTGDDGDDSLSLLSKSQKQTLAATLARHQRITAERTRDEFLFRQSCIAYTAFLRAYAAHTRTQKEFFHPRTLHLGHVATSFALVEAPTKINQIAISARNDRQYWLEKMKKSRSLVNRGGNRARQPTISHDSIQSLQPRDSQRRAPIILNSQKKTFDNYDDDDNGNDGNDDDGDYDEDTHLEDHSNSNGDEHDDRDSGDADYDYELDAPDGQHSDSEPHGSFQRSLNHAGDSRSKKNPASSVKSSSSSSKAKKVTKSIPNSDDESEHNADDDDAGVADSASKPSSVSTPNDRSSEREREREKRRLKKQEKKKRDREAMESVALRSEHDDVDDEFVAKADESIRASEPKEITSASERQDPQPSSGKSDTDTASTPAVKRARVSNTEVPSSSIQSTTPKVPKLVESVVQTPAKTPKSVEATTKTPAKTPKSVEAIAKTPAKTPKSVEAITNTPAKTPKPVEVIEKTPLKTPAKPVDSGAQNPNKTPKARPDIAVESSSKATPKVPATNVESRSVEKGRLQSSNVGKVSGTKVTSDIKSSSKSKTAVSNKSDDNYHAGSVGVGVGDDDEDDIAVPVFAKPSHAGAVSFDDDDGGGENLDGPTDPVTSKSSTQKPQAPLKASYFSPARDSPAAIAAAAAARAALIPVTPTVGSFAVAMSRARIQNPTFCQVPKSGAPAAAKPGSTDLSGEYAKIAGWQADRVAMPSVDECGCSTGAADDAESTTTILKRRVGEKLELHVGGVGSPKSLGGGAAYGKLLGTPVMAPASAVKRSGPMGTGTPKNRKRAVSMSELLTSEFSAE